ncbi:MAG TPA: hypothetical protein VGE07_23045, partial [Herpetosiphonaceae bacterium]
MAASDPHPAHRGLGAQKPEPALAAAPGPRPAAAMAEAAADRPSASLQAAAQAAKAKTAPSLFDTQTAGPPPGSSGDGAQIGGSAAPGPQSAGGKDKPGLGPQTA